MTANQLILEQAWVTRFQARAARLISQLQRAIAASQRITARRWNEGLVTL